MNFFKEHVGTIVNKDLISRRDYYNKVIDSWLELRSDNTHECMLIFCENTVDLFKLLYKISFDRKDIVINKQFKAINQCVVELTNVWGEFCLRFEIYNINNISESMRGHKGVSLIFDLTEIPLSKIPISEDIHNCVLLPLIYSMTKDKPYHNVTILYYDLWEVCDEKEFK